jgi:hypothetical protein
MSNVGLPQGFVLDSSVVLTEAASGCKGKLFIQEYSSRRHQLVMLCRIKISTPEDDHRGSLRSISPNFVHLLPN